MKSIRTLTTVIFAISASALTALAGDPSGTWKFQAEGPKGHGAESTLILKWENNQLSGQIDNRVGKVDIADPRFADDHVTFSVVREVGRLKRKQTLTMRYSGKLEGDRIKGTIEVTGRGEKSMSIPWEAQRAK